MHSSLTGVNADCLLLSASKRTLDACVAKVSSCVPDLVKTALATSETLGPRRHDVFRDSLVTFLSFQSVYWQYPRSSSPQPPPTIEIHPPQHEPVDRKNSLRSSMGSEHIATNTTTTTTTTTPNAVAASIETFLTPGIHQFLVLGFANGVQVWTLCRPDTGAWWDAKPYLASTTPTPPATQAVSFRTPGAVRLVQLLDDLPPALPTIDTISTKRRVAIVLASAGQWGRNTPQPSSVSETSFAVEIYAPEWAGIGSTVGTKPMRDSQHQHPSSHVLRQPWPIVELASSLCWGNGGWLSSLIVATTAQIRVYDTVEFSVRFTISNFLAVAMPPLWDWLAARQGRTTCPPSPQLFISSNTVKPDDAESPTPHPSSDAAATAATGGGFSAALSGPVFAVGTRWLVYQETTRVPSPAAAPPHVTEEDEGGRRVGWSARLHQAWLRATEKTALFARIRDTHASSSFTALLGSLPPFPRPRDLLRQATPSIVSEVPVSYGSSSTASSISQGTGMLQRHLTGGRLVLIDMATGEEVGTLWAGCDHACWQHRDKLVEVPRRDAKHFCSSRADVNGHDYCGSHTNPEKHKGIEVPKAKDNIRSQSDTAFTESYRSWGFKTTVPSRGPLVQVGEATDGPWCLSYVVNNESYDSYHGTSVESSKTETPVYDAPPVMALMRFDPSMTTLFCADWTGRTVWVFRLLSASSSRRPVGQPLFVEGAPVLLLQRGRTVGTIVDIACSRNLYGGDSCVTVTTSRGSCHCFKLPSGFHLTQLRDPENDAPLCRLGDHSTFVSLPLSFPATLRSTLSSTARHHQLSTCSSQLDVTMLCQSGTCSSGWDSLPYVADTQAVDSEQSATPVYCVLDEEPLNASRTQVHPSPILHDTPATLQLSCTQPQRRLQDHRLPLRSLPRLRPIARITLVGPTESVMHQRSMEDDSKNGIRCQWRVTFPPAPFLSMYSSTKRRRRPLVFLPFLTAAPDGVLEFFGATYVRKRLRKRIFLHPTSSFNSLDILPVRKTSFSQDPTSSVASPKDSKMANQRSPSKDSRASGPHILASRHRRKNTEPILSPRTQDSEPHTWGGLRCSAVQHEGERKTIRPARAIPTNDGVCSMRYVNAANDPTALLESQNLTLASLELAGTFHSLTLSTRELNRWARTNEIPSEQSQSNTRNASESHSGPEPFTCWSRLCEPLTSVPSRIVYRYIGYSHGSVVKEYSDHPHSCKTTSHHCFKKNRRSKNTFEPFHRGIPAGRHSATCATSPSYNSGSVCLTSCHNTIISPEHSVVTTTVDYPRDFPRRRCQQGIDDAISSCILANPSSKVYKPLIRHTLSHGTPAYPCSTTNITLTSADPVSDCTTPMAVDSVNHNSHAQMYRFPSPLLTSRSNHPDLPDETVDDYVRYPF